MLRPGECICTIKRLTSTDIKGESVYIRSTRCPVVPLLSTDYSFAINETMSVFAEKPSYEVDLGARYASIAIREQLRLIQQGIAALVYLSAIAPTMTILT